MKKEELLNYINHAIQVESNMLSQQNLIREYDENSEKRKPQLVEKGKPNAPEIKRLPNSIREHKANALISEDTKALAFNLIVEITEPFSVFCVGTLTLNKPHL